MNVIKTVRQMQDYADACRESGITIGLVPTMGFLHEGHLTLMRSARERADALVVSIFVNPTQFGPNEDFESYPRDTEQDLSLAEQEGVDAVFMPDRPELYEKEYQTYVSLEKLPDHLCGLSRPVHFRGVATVVSKLFNIVKPHVAVFGEKDYQQLAVIRQMTRDLNFDVEIHGVPIVREPDGLAMSSRNNYLTETQRKTALCLHQSLHAAQKSVSEGVKDARAIIREIEKQISSHPETGIDYVKICDPDTLDDLLIIDRHAVMALAVKVGKTRLIDNMILNPLP